MKDMIFDPHARTVRPAPSEADIDAARMEFLRLAGSIGSRNAVSLLVPLLGSLLWSESLPPRGRAFDHVTKEITRALRDQIALLEQQAATAMPAASFAGMVQ